MAGGGGGRVLGFSKDFTIMVVKDYAGEERKKFNFLHYFYFQYLPVTPVHFCCNCCQLHQKSH